MKRILITGSSGLIGSTAARYFDRLGYAVLGIDNNLRRDFYGPNGDTSRNLSWLKEHTRNFRHESIDIRSRRAVGLLLASSHFDLIIHCAGQPSGELARIRPLDDFDINAVGTMNLLEAARQSCPEAPFITMSTSKVYGAAVNQLPLIELDSRFDYARPEHREGIAETTPIDGTAHGLLGASKLAADLMTQEYGHTYRLPTCVLRAGCITGPRHPGDPQHGFLGHLVSTVRSGQRYRICGFKGKRVIDPLHAEDLVRAMHAIAQAPRTGEVYNIGGGRGNATSVLESISRLERITGGSIATDYQPLERPGEHICYVSDLRKFRAHYPAWAMSYDLDAIYEDLLRDSGEPPRDAAPTADTAFELTAAGASDVYSPFF